MREVDRRGKYSRRIFLQGAASAVPVVAVAASAGLGIEDAWAADATTLTPATLKTLVKVARDIYPHDMLVDSYYITAIKPWDAKAAKDPAVKALIEGGVQRLDQDAQDRHPTPNRSDNIARIHRTSLIKLTARGHASPGRATSSPRDRPGSPPSMDPI